MDNIYTRTIIYYVSSMGNIVKHDSCIILYVLYATYDMKEHESIAVNVYVHHHFCYRAVVDLFFFILSVFPSFFLSLWFSYRFVLWHSKHYTQERQCEHYSQQFVCECMCGDFFLFLSVSLIRIFKVNIFVNDDVIGRMQSIKAFNAFIYLFFRWMKQQIYTCVKYEITAHFRFNVNEFGGEEGRGRSKTIFAISSHTLCLWFFKSQQ